MEEQNMLYVRVTFASSDEWVYRATPIEVISAMRNWLGGSKYIQLRNIKKPVQTVLVSCFTAEKGEPWIKRIEVSPVKY